MVWIKALSSTVLAAFGLYYLAMRWDIVERIFRIGIEAQWGELLLPVILMALSVFVWFFRTGGKE